MFFVCEELSLTWSLNDCPDFVVLNPFAIVPNGYGCGSGVFADIGS